MNHEAPVDHSILEIIRKRWSPRSFSDKNISQDDLNKIFEAARWSASAGNIQPWNYVYAFKGTEGFKKLFDCLDDGNRKWNKNAAVLIASIAKKTTAKGEPNDWAQHDTGMADAHLLLQATSMDIYAHPMAGFYKEKVIEKLQLDAEYEPICMIALGYLDVPEN